MSASKRRISLIPLHILTLIVGVIMIFLSVFDMLNGNRLYSFVISTDVILLAIIGLYASKREIYSEKDIKTTREGFALVTGFAIILSSMFAIILLSIFPMLIPHSTNPLVFAIVFAVYFIFIWTLTISRHRANWSR